MVVMMLLLLLLLMRTAAMDARGRDSDERRYKFVGRRREKNGT